MSAQISIDRDQIATFCRRRHIRRLAFFGSVLRDDFRPDSDVDVLMEFEPGHVVGFNIIEIEEELSQMLGGHKVDLVTEKYLNRRLRNRVLANAEIQYVKNRRQIEEKTVRLISYSATGESIELQEVGSNS